MTDRQTKAEEQLILQDPAPERPIWEAFAWPLISFAFVAVGDWFPELNDWANAGLAPLLLTFALSLFVTVMTSVAFMRALFARAGFAESLRFVLRRDSISGIIGGIALGVWIMVLALASGMSFYTPLLTYLALLCSVFLIAKGMDAMYRDQYLVYAVSDASAQELRARTQQALPFRTKLLSRFTGKNGYARNTVLWTGIIFILLTPSAGIVGNWIDSTPLIGLVSTLVQFGFLALWVKAAERGSLLALILRSPDKPMIRQR